MKYAVQTLIGADIFEGTQGTWENVWREGAGIHNPEGTPTTFATRLDAEQAVKDHIRDCIEAVEAGNMDDSPDPSYFRIVEVMKGAA